MYWLLSITLLNILFEGDSHLLIYVSSFLQDILCLCIPKFRVYKILNTSRTVDHKSDFEVKLKNSYKYKCEFSGLLPLIQNKKLKKL